MRLWILDLSSKISLARVCCHANAGRMETQDLAPLSQGSSLADHRSPRRSAAETLGVIAS